MGGRRWCATRWTRHCPYSIARQFRVGYVRENVTTAVSSQWLQRLPRRAYPQTVLTVGLLEYTLLDMNSPVTEMCAEGQEVVRDTLDTVLPVLNSGTALVDFDEEGA